MCILWVMLDTLCSDLWLGKCLPSELFLSLCLVRALDYFPPSRRCQRFRIRACVVCIWLSSLAPLIAFFNFATADTGSFGMDGSS
ncbi:hypothetical protein BDR06DRAFT_625118 [Suillus hirtellus]|nr:hypothetical protein BDR06DRAFT_625118 [Suillus hirtellus]